MDVGGLSTHPNLMVRVGDVMELVSLNMMETLQIFEQEHKA